MKQFVTLLLFVAAISLCQAQSTQPIQFWVYGTAGHYFPAVQNNMVVYTHQGWDAGLGVYGSIPLSQRFSVQAGLGYRYLLNGQTYYTEANPGGYGGYYSGYYGSSYYTDYDMVWAKYSEYAKHYLTLPIKLRYTSKWGVYLESGAEAAWLLNYKYRTSKTEFNWLVGAGIQLGNVDCSLQYVNALARQSIGGKVAGGPWEQEGFRNRMFNLQVAYPLGK
ncbi:MAG: hypothetical protein ACK5JD_13345 [Mangrovibacterium sp.]